MDQISLPPGFQDLLSFRFLDALLGRRSRRFFVGAEIPDGVFANKSWARAGTQKSPGWASGTTPMIAGLIRILRG